MVHVMSILNTHFIFTSHKSNKFCQGEKILPDLTIVNFCLIFHLSWTMSSNFELTTCQQWWPHLLLENRYKEWPHISTSHFHNQSYSVIIAASAFNLISSRFNVHLNSITNQWYGYISIMYSSRTTRLSHAV